MQLKQFYNIATKVSSRKKCHYFWWSTWLFIAGQEGENAYLPVAHKNAVLHPVTIWTLKDKLQLNTRSGHKLCKVNKPHHNFSSKLFD